MVGVVHKEINLSSPSGIIHGHLITLVRHKQARMCLQSDPKCYEQFSTNFKNILFQQIFYCITHSPMRSVKHNRKLATASHLRWKCLEFRGKKPFTIFLNAYAFALFSYSFSFDPWPLLLSMAACKGHVWFPTSCQASHIT